WRARMSAARPARCARRSRMVHACVAGKTVSTSAPTTSPFTRVRTPWYASPISPKVVAPVRRRDGPRLPRWIGGSVGSRRRDHVETRHETEVDTMETRSVGTLEVSVAGLGCNNFGMRIDDAAAQQVVDAALDAGINHFDTADIYGKGRSEEFLAAPSASAGPTP